jgi:RNA polymerase sigma factor (sigma-70 family)
MSTRPTALLRHLHRLASAGPGELAADSFLLERFVRDRDDNAFAVLVARHGPLVRGVCQRVLAEVHAADDAFQAVFLVLARRAAEVRPQQSLASWLHGVAYRVALKSRAIETKRRRRETSSAELDPTDPRPDPLGELSARELLTALDEELQRLTDAHRLPILLCCLEGRSQEEAASMLGWTVGSVKGRLERGRANLHARLARRGLTLSAALAAVEMSRVGSAHASCLVSVVAFRSGLALSARRVCGDTITARAVAAMEGVGRSIGMTKLKWAVVVLLTLSIVGAGTASLIFRAGVVNEQAADTAPEQRAASSREGSQKQGADLRDPPENARAKAGVAPPDAKRPAVAAAEQANIQALVDAARKVYEGTLARMKVDVNAHDFEPPCQWSRRWLEAERQLESSHKGQVAAVRAHLDRMKKLEAEVRKFRADGFATELDVAVVGYFRLEAERRLILARAGASSGK